MLMTMEGREETQETSNQQRIITNTLKVSVIIPVFNVEPYLKEALDSVISQTYFNLEILIIDDGSTDGSGEICDEYKRDPRVHVIHQENGGLSVARNTGLNYMTGDVVAFLDSDDAYHPDYIKLMLETMKQENADMVISKFTVHETTGKLNGDSQRAYSPKAREGCYSRDEALRALADGNINHSVWNKLYCADLWDNIRYPAGRVYEDRDTTYKALEKCNTVFVLDRPLYFYRKRRGSITNDHSKSTIEDRMLACCHFASYVENNTPKIFNKKQLRKSKEDCINWLISIYIHCFGKRIGGWISNDDLKTVLIETGKKMQVKTCGLRTRTAYWMAISCPCLLKAIHSVYHPAHLLVLKVIKR